MPSAADEAAATRLEVRGLRKVFGNTVALRSANLELRGGEIHGLLGENGAGKSTLIRILAGLYEPDGGEVIIGGAAAGVGPGPGLAFIHQEPVAFPDLSVAENIALLTGYPLRWRFVRWAKVRSHARTVLGRLGIDVDVRREMAALPVATRTMVAIAAALANDATTVILDEPTASLSAHEVQSLFAVLRELRQRGIALLLVTHRIDEVMEMCDRVTVLRDGVTVGRRRIGAITAKELVALIVGEEVVLEAPAGAGAAPETEPVLEVIGAAAEGLPGPITFSLRRGEILGFTGSIEAGHHAVGELVFGLRPAVAGKLRLGNTPYTPSDPRGALAHGIRYVAPDRNVQGLAAHLSLQENLFMNGTRDRGSARLLVGTRRERREAVEALKRFDVRPPNPRAEVSTLSGGNAQKLMLARCFLGNPKLVVLTEPTAGVDIGARASIYDILRRQAQRAVGVIVISSDFEEIHDVCDRCFVLHRGRIVQELAREAATVAAITSAAL
jgi:ribose transport system ATP-binding protein